MLETVGVVNKLVFYVTVPTITRYQSFFSTLCAAFGVGACGFFLVSFAGVFVGGAGVAVVDLVTVGPTAIGVGREVARVGVGSGAVARFVGQFYFDASKVCLREVEFGDGLRELLREVAVGGGQIGNGGTI